MTIPGLVFGLFATIGVGLVYLVIGTLVDAARTMFQGQRPWAGDDWSPWVISLWPFCAVAAILALPISILFRKFTDEEETDK